jgi:hypothetical protein
MLPVILVSILFLIQVLCPSAYAQTAAFEPTADASNNVCKDKSDNHPYWGSPADIYKLNPTQENMELAEWCKKAEAAISPIVVQQEGWQKYLVGNYYFFFLSPDGQIEDPLISCLDKRLGEKFVRATVPKLGNFPKPPGYLKGRRLCLDLSYPRIRIDVDLQEPVKDAKYFDQFRISGPKSNQ